MGKAMSRSRAHLVGKASLEIYSDREPELPSSQRAAESHPSSVMTACLPSRTAEL